MNNSFNKGEITAQTAQNVQSTVSTFTEYRKFDGIPLTMTAAQYESTDFYEYTDKLLVDYIIAFGEVYQLSRKFAVTIVDEEGKPTCVHNITASIAPETFLFAHPDIVKDQITGGYKFGE